MPYQSPASRHLLLGIAALMFGASLSDAGVLLRKFRQWRMQHSERVVMVVGR